MGLVCSTNHLVTLPGGSEHRLTVEVCRSGTALPPGTYGRLTSRGGRMHNVQGALVFERITRAPDEAAGVPILLSPRNTAIHEPRPALVWTRVPDAWEYEISVRGDITFVETLDASRCTPGPESETVCSTPYPEDAPDLPPGGLVQVTLGARTRNGPMRQEQAPLWIRRLSPARADQLSARLNELSSLPAGDVAHRLLAAGIHAEQGSYGEAIRLYREALTLQEIPEVRVTLGDVCLAVGLASHARQSYERAAVRAEPPVQAAVEYGRGRVELAYGHHGPALSHFKKARKLFRRLHLEEETSAAEKAMALAEEGLANPVP